MCDAHAGEAVHRRRFVLFDGHPLASGYTVVTCRNCGAAYATPLPPQEAFERFYRDASKYADAATGTGSGAQLWDDERLANTARELSLFVSERDAHIVDLGCAAGGLLRQFAALDYHNLTGIDPAPACAEAVEKIPGVRGVVGSLFALPARVAPASLVVLSHVMEHVREVGLAVEALRQLVRPGGRVYVECPDAARYADYLVAPFLDFNTEHINHFSVRTLERMFSAHRWDVVASGTKDIASSPTSCYPCAWVLAELPREAREATPVTADVALRAALVRYVRMSEALLAGVVKRCESLKLDGREVFVWGTGQTTAILLADTPLARARIRAFTDSNPVHHGRTIAGVHVVPPAELRATPEVPIVIGSLLHGPEIAMSIAALGLTNPVIRLDPSAP